MTPRRTILELFTTFVQFANDRFSGWAIDSRLKRSMSKMLASSEWSDTSTKPIDRTEQFWVAYWHQQWQMAHQSGSTSSQAPSASSEGAGREKQMLSFNHLAAYLQETCYWIAQRSTTLTSQQFNLADYFQIAIAALPKIIQGYAPDYGASLKTYASLCFSNAIRDGLRRQREADSRSNWGLLRKLSQKSFREMLSQIGLGADTIASYQLAWSCFKLYCAPTNPTATRQLPDPDRATWHTIADLYNRQRLKLSTVPVPATPALLEQWLTQCAKQARNYLHPPLSSLNVVMAGRTDELQDQLSADDEISPMVALLVQESIEERQVQRTQIYQVLTDAIARLSPQMQELLALYYGQQLIQQQIADRLEVKQYTISRHLSRSKETLVLAIAEWSQDHLHSAPTSTAVKAISVLLEEWLEVYYQTANHSSKEASL